jgi:integrase/recombinase XerD
VLHDTGCRISEALALTSESIALSRQGRDVREPQEAAPRIYRAVPVPPTLLDTLDMVHGIREAQKRGGGQSDHPLWP